MPVVKRFSGCRSSIVTITDCIESSLTSCTCGALALYALFEKKIGLPVVLGAFVVGVGFDSS